MSNNIDNIILSLIKKTNPKKILKIGSENTDRIKKLLERCNDLNIDLSIATSIPDFELLKIESENKNMSLITGILPNNLNNLNNFDIIIIDNVTDKTKTLKPILNKIDEKTENFPMVLIEIITKDIYNDIYKIKDINEIIEEHVNTSKNNINYHSIYNYSILQIIYTKNINTYRIINEIDTYAIKNNPYYIEYLEIIKKNRKLNEKIKKLEERTKILSKQTVEQYNQIKKI